MGHAHSLSLRHILGYPFLWAAPWEGGSAPPTTSCISVGPTVGAVQTHSPH